MQETYLAHHGILGQKWGVRRYQNQDGSLTAEGKQRYTRKDFKRMSADRFVTQNKAYMESEAYKRSKAYSDRANRLAEKYGLDADDGGGGDTSRFTEAAISRAGQRYLDYWDISEEWDRKARNEAEAYTKQYMLDKYGQEGVDALKQHDTRVAAASVAAFMAIPTALIIFS